MADLDRIKRNVAKMAGMNAPEADIDAYIASEGVTIDAVRAHKTAAPKIEAPAPVSQRGNFADLMVGQGLMMGFGDEAKAGVRAAASKLTGDERPLGEIYGQNVARERADVAGFRERNPKTAMGAEIAGAVLTAPVLPGSTLAKGATMLARMKAGSKAGAAYGGIYGAGTGEDLTSRMTGAGLGTVTGGLVGGAVPLAIGGAQTVGRGIRDASGRVAATARGAINPEREATRRIGVAAQMDDALPQERLSAADEQAALARGQPVMNIDRGGETVRALAHSSANQSPTGRALLEQGIGDRFAAQGDRTVDMVRQIVGGASTEQNRQLLQKSARAANDPAYRRAYSQPRAVAMWDAELEQLASAPIMQDAIRQATVTGRNAGAAAGSTPVRNPFRIDPKSGRLSLAVDAKGTRTAPTLEFWDHVKRNLDAVGTREAKQFSKVLREHLDSIVPEYRQARAGAAQFFGAGDALEAGDAFVSSRMRNEEAKAALAKMSGPERTLFAEGFADSLVRRISEVSDRRAVINSVFLRSKASRERVEMALGPQRAKELEAFLRVEDLLDRARGAVKGHSTTARQLVELGIGSVGGASYGQMTGDWTTGAAVIAGFLSRAGAQRINARVAERVAKMLASPDPKIVRNGLRMVANNDNWMSALRAADLPAARGATPALPQMPYGSVNAAADRDDPGRPGVGGY